MRDEANLLAALEIVSYSAHLRKSVADKYWREVQSKIDKKLQGQPKLEWEADRDKAGGQEYPGTNGCLSDESPAGAIMYGLEADRTYIGFGLIWRARHLVCDRFLDFRAGRELKAIVVKRGCAWYDPKKVKDWLCWKCLEGDLNCDPWTWFAREFTRDATEPLAQEGVAARFCEFVKETHQTVAAANKALARRKV